MERGMKGEVGALASGIGRRGETGRRDGKWSEGKELISFNTHTSSYMRIITDLINAVYSEQVGKCVCCANDCTLCVHLLSYVPLGRRGSCSDVYVCTACEDLCVCVCTCADVVRRSKILRTA